MTKKTIHITPAVSLLVAEGLDLTPYLIRHFGGDHGEITEAEQCKNRESRHSSTDLVLSVYSVTPQVTLWVTTRADKTLVMLPLA